MPLPVAKVFHAIQCDFVHSTITFSRLWLSTWDCWSLQYFILSYFFFPCTGILTGHDAALLILQHVVPTVIFFSTLYLKGMQGSLLISECVTSLTYHSPCQDASIPNQTDNPSVWSKLQLMNNTSSRITITTKLESWSSNRCFQLNTFLNKSTTSIHSTYCWLYTTTIPYHEVLINSILRTIIRSNTLI